jgi:hypothetical protein
MIVMRGTTGIMAGTMTTRATIMATMAAAITTTTGTEAFGREVAPQPMKAARSARVTGRRPGVNYDLLPMSLRRQMHRLFFILPVLLSCVAILGFAQSLTDDQIRFLMIQDSIAHYPGNCPCPFSTNSAGNKCGKSSAWNEAGDYAPLCYSRDVSGSMVKAYRKLHGLGQ